MRSLTVRTLLALSAGGSGCLLAQPAFSRWDVLIGVTPQVVVAGDFNGDRRPDLAVVTDDAVFTLLNTGNHEDGRMFGRPIRTEGFSGGDLLTDFFAQFVGAADFNGDGRDDLVGNGVLLLSRGDGTFQPARRDLAAIVGIGDFNRDGKMDLLQSDLVPGAYLKGVRVLLGNGDGTFRPGATITTVLVEQVVVADFNRDGRMDAAVLPHPLPEIPFLVFPGQGDGSFGAEIRTQIGFALMWPFLAADFNGDGIPDLTTGEGIALGKGDGTFQAPVRYPRAPVGLPIAVGDFTGDGRTDLVTLNLGERSISIFPGKGDGTLLSPTEQSVAWGAWPPAVAVDLDYPGDGRLDLATANYYSNSVSVLRQTAVPGEPTLRRAVSAASGNAVVAPESLATLMAPTPATGGLSAYVPYWLTSLGGISLEVRDSAGATRLAPLLYVSPTQVNFQVPAGTALGLATLAIRDARGSTVAGGIQVESVAPALFQVFPSFYATPAATAVLVEADGTQFPIPVYTCAPSATGFACDASQIPLSAAGDRAIYLSFFGTGFGGGKPGNVTCEINGVQVPVVYAGPQEAPGVEQINVRLLPKVLEGFYGEQMQVTIRIDGVAANSVWIAVR